MEIAGHDAKWFSQPQILDKIRASMNTLDLKVITPMMYQKPVRMTLRNLETRLKLLIKNGTKIEFITDLTFKLIFLELIILI